MRGIWSQSGLLLFCVYLATFSSCGSALAQESFLDQVRDLLPNPGVLCYPETRLSDYHFVGDSGPARFSVVPVDGEPFSEAVRVEVSAPQQPVWNVQLMSPRSTAPLHKDDVLLFVFHARSLDTERAALSAYIQSTSTGWTGLGNLSVLVGSSWKRYFVTGHAEQDFAAGTYEVTFHLGSKAQKLEIGGMALLDLGPGVDIAELPYNPIDYPGSEEDAPWRAIARERIEQYRKSDLTVRIVDDHGRPLRGARIRAHMLRHAYGFGSFMEPSLVEQGPDPDADQHRYWFLKLFNRATVPIYWADWGWADSQVRDRYLRMAQWARDNDLAIRGHVLVYPRFDILPAFMGRFRNSPAEFQSKILAHISECVQATNPYGFRDYDVTNELRDAGDVLNVVGREGVVQWFAEARNFNSVSRMGLNEYGILTRGGATETEQGNYEDWLRYLSEHGQAADVIGIQGHFDNDVTAPERIWEILDRFAQFHVPVHITEFDLLSPDEEGQARYLRDFYTAVFSHPATEAITCWGFWEGQMWRPGAAWFREDWSLKPAAQAYIDLVLGEWWTDVSGRTDVNGEFRVSGFLGDYEIAVTSGGRESTVRLQLGHGGTTRTVRVEGLGVGPADGRRSIPARNPG